MDKSYQVVPVPERQRYELRSQDRVIGSATALPHGDVIVVPHVEVNPEFEGQGFGSRLVRGVLDDIRAQGKKVSPLCPFVRSFIQRYPEYADLQA